MMDTHPGFIATSYTQYDTHICLIESDVLMEAPFSLSKEYITQVFTVLESKI